MDEIRAMEASDYLVQIANLLVNSPDVPTDESDVADAAAIVQTVKTALEWLMTWRTANSEQRCAIDSLSARLEECRGMNRAAQVEIERLNDQIQNWNIGANELQGKYLAAQREIGALAEQLSAAKRKNDRYAVELGESLSRYEGMTEAFRIALDKLTRVPA